MPETSLPDYVHTLRVYWEDTDAGGVVFYANYLKFFERARTEWLRALGHGQEQLRHEEGAMFVVTDTSIRYLQPARLDDLLEVSVKVEHAGRARMTIAQQAWLYHKDPIVKPVPASAATITATASPAPAKSAPAKPTPIKARKPAAPKAPPTKPAGKK